jgi:hypothetical protein
MNRLGFELLPLEQKCTFYAVFYLSTLYSPCS